MVLERRTPLGRGKPLQPGGPLARSAALGRGDARLASVTPLQRGGRIRPVSGRRRQENADRRAMVAALTGGERPLCAVWALLQPDWCAVWADDAHEPLSRGRGGSITDPANCIPVCRPCHDVLTFRPESEIPWAYQHGLLKHSGLCCQGQAACSRYADPEEAA